ncbi:DUF5862 family protein [Pseudomonas aeruginosa]|nr:hypothetical protein [Pseudomonas aeruginosa]MDF5998479.1 hypothetical protein [Pseudomonas aeruginosa]
MKELNDIEVTCVSGGTLSGMIVGAVDGAATGMAIGGKWGGAGGFGFGALSQLVGLVVPTAMGAIAGARSVSSPMRKRLSVTWANTGKTSVPVM